MTTVYQTIILKSPQLINGIRQILKPFSPAIQARILPDEKIIPNTPNNLLLSVMNMESSELTNLVQGNLISLLKGGFGFLVGKGIFHDYKSLTKALEDEKSDVYEKDPEYFNALQKVVDYLINNQLLFLNALAFIPDINKSNVSKQIIEELHFINAKITDKHLNFLTNKLEDSIKTESKSIETKVDVYLLKLQALRLALSANNSPPEKIKADLISLQEVINNLEQLPKKGKENNFSVVDQALQQCEDFLKTNLVKHYVLKINEIAKINANPHATLDNIKAKRNELQKLIDDLEEIRGKFRTKPRFSNCIQEVLEPAEQLAANLQDKIRDAEMKILEAKAEAKNTAVIDEDFFNQGRQRTTHNLNNEF